MRILNSFAVQQDSILQTGVCVRQLSQNRRQKVFNRGSLCLCGGLDILKIDNNSTDLQCFTFQFGGAWSFVWGSKPTEAPPLATGLSPSKSHYAPLLLFDEILTQPHFAVVNCSDEVMSVFYSTVLTRCLIFLQLCTSVAVLTLFSSDILTWRADSSYCHDT